MLITLNLSLNLLLFNVNKTKMSNKTVAGDCRNLA